MKKEKPERWQMHAATFIVARRILGFTQRAQQSPKKEVLTCWYSSIDRVKNLWQIERLWCWGESRIVTPDAPQRPVPSKNQSIQRFEVTCRKGNSSTFPIAGLALYKVLLICKRGMKSGTAMRAQCNARRVCNGRECNRPVDDTWRTDRARRRRSQPISTSSESASAVRNA